MSPWRRSAWVFDLDGTLTEAVHDFDAMRRDLGVPPGVPILEALAGLGEVERREAARRVEDWEWEHASLARPAPGVPELLEALAAAGAQLGVLTRNLHEIARRTLAVAGLDGWFRDEHVIGRSDAAPKPAPDGVLRLLRRWGAPARQGVMVGDHLHDLAAGRAAGVLTVLVRADVPEAWRAHADLAVPDARALLAVRGP